MKLTHVTQLPALHATGQHLGRVEDAVLDLANDAVAYWRISLGSRLRAVPVLISADRVAVHDDQLTVHLNLDTLEAARDAAEEALEATDPIIDPAAIPSLVPLSVGPAFSPFMPSHFGFRPRETELPSGAPGGWVWAHDVLDKPLFTTRGELGRISDVEIDTTANRMTEILVRGRNGETSFVEASALRHIPEERTHFVADASGGMAPSA